MARKLDARPLFDVRPEFTASMDRFAHEAGMLCDAVSTVLSHGEQSGIKSGVAELLRERVAAFRRAQTGEP
jgi:hypothetical protein